MEWVSNTSQNKKLFLQESAAFHLQPFHHFYNNFFNPRFGVKKSQLKVCSIKSWPIPILQENSEFLAHFQILKILLENSIVL